MLKRRTKSLFISSSPRAKSHAETAAAAASSPTKMNESKQGEKGCKSARRGGKYLFQRLPTKKTFFHFFKESQRQSPSPFGRLLFLPPKSTHLFLKKQLLPPFLHPALQLPPPL